MVTATAVLAGMLPAAVATPVAAEPGTDLPPLIADPPPPPRPAAMAAADEVAAAPYPYAQTFQLHSKAGSNKTIYLDFDGHTIQNTDWPADNAGPYTSAPSNWDSDPASFSDTEHDRIQDVWQRVAEDFAPFDVDVTTQDPGLAAIERVGTSDQVFGTRVAITGSPSQPIYPGTGIAGVAFIGVFDRTADHSRLQPAWVFSAVLGSTEETADVVSHEAGHNLGLGHDGYPNGEYYGGHDHWSPLMGGSERPLSQWSKGEYAGATNTEDDFAVMASHGLVARADDHGNTVASATALALGTPVTGVITASSPGEMDVFRYLALSAGTVAFSATPAPTGPNLDIRLRLLNSAGTVLATADPPAQVVGSSSLVGLEAAITRTVTFGQTYYLSVGPASLTTPSGGYSTYGSVGAYTLQAGAPVCPPADDYEPNDTLATASPVDGPIYASVCPGNDDWYAVPGYSGNPITASAAFPGATGNIDLALYGPGGTVVATSASTGDAEAITYAPVADGAHQLRVTTTAPNSYDLDLRGSVCPDPYEPNDDYETPWPVARRATIDAQACIGDWD